MPSIAPCSLATSANCSRSSLKRRNASDTRTESGKHHRRSGDLGERGVVVEQVAQGHDADHVVQVARRG